MAEYIEKKEVLKAVMLIERREDIYMHVRCLPVVEIEDATRGRKRGHWVERNPQNSDRCRLIECDQCGHGAIVGFNIPFDEYTACDRRHYCGCCDADMWGKDKIKQEVVCNG